MRSLGSTPNAQICVLSPSLMRWQRLADRAGWVDRAGIGIGAESAADARADTLKVRPTRGRFVRFVRSACASWRRLAGARRGKGGARYAPRPGGIYAPRWIPLKGYFHRAAQKYAHHRNVRRAQKCAEMRRCAEWVRLGRPRVRSGGVLAAGRRACWQCLARLAIRRAGRFGDIGPGHRAGHAFAVRGY